jgi:hypothetical protein
MMKPLHWEVDQNITRARGGSQTQRKRTSKFTSLFLNPLWNGRDTTRIVGQCLRTLHKIRNYSSVWDNTNNGWVEDHGNLTLVP